MKLHPCTLETSVFEILHTFLTPLFSQLKSDTKKYIPSSCSRFRMYLKFVSIYWNIPYKTCNEPNRLDVIEIMVKSNVSRLLLCIGHHKIFTASLIMQLNTTDCAWIIICVLNASFVWKSIIRPFWLNYL